MFACAVMGSSQYGGVGFVLRRAQEGLGHYRYVYSLRSYTETDLGVNRG